MVNGIKARILSAAGPLFVSPASTTPLARSEMLSREVLAALTSGEPVLIEGRFGETGALTIFAGRVTLTVSETGDQIPAGQFHTFARGMPMSPHPHSAFEALTSAGEVIWNRYVAEGATINMVFAPGDRKFPPGQVIACSPMEAALFRHASQEIGARTTALRPMPTLAASGPTETSVAQRDHKDEKDGKGRASAALPTPSPATAAAHAASSASSVASTSAQTQQTSPSTAIAVPSIPTSAAPFTAPSTTSMPAAPRDRKDAKDAKTTPSPLAMEPAAVVEIERAYVQASSSTTTTAPPIRSGTQSDTAGSTFSGSPDDAH